MESTATTHKALAEEFVVQINKTLLKWDANGKNPDFQDMRSMILSWLTKMFYRIYDYRQVKRLIHSKPVITLSSTNPAYLTSITFNTYPTDTGAYWNSIFSSINYYELAGKAQLQTPAPSTILEVNFQSIENIKF